MIRVNHVPSLANIISVNLTITPTHENPEDFVVDGTIETGNLNMAKAIQNIEFCKEIKWLNEIR